MTDLKPFDRVAEIYDETRALAPGAVAEIADAIAAILREVAAPPRLLEVGIGTGRIAVPLAERGVRVAGTDIAPKMVARLREKRDDIDVVLAEAAHPPFADTAFDAVLLVHILHLVPDVPATVRAAVAALRPAGALLLGFEDYDGVRQGSDDIMERIGRELKPDMSTGRDGQQRVDRGFRAGAVAAEMTVEHRVLARWTESITARAILDSNTGRHGSGSWNHSDEFIRESVRRAEPELVALFGGLDRPREFERTFEILIGRRNV